MFIKNDNEFTCVNCLKKVEKLRYTSRDHCNHCLYSIHVDVFPGDRANECRVILKPINVEIDAKKGKQIVYRCLKCGKIVRNIVAEDDDVEEIYRIVNEYSRNGGK